MTFSAAALHAVLEAHVPPGASGLAVALSGGLDSACLATALSQLLSPPGMPPRSVPLPSAARAGPSSSSVAPAAPAGIALWRGLPVRAIHVDHGLQAAAGEFRAACHALCSKLALRLDVIDVVVATDGVSIEAAARDARYRAIARQLEPGECLLTAHHAADQAETLLLQLLRGAGVKGLSAMPFCRVLGAGWQLRPLLETPQGELLRFAAAAGVTGVCDPMNHDLRFDRAYLRARLWPPIEERWPGAAVALVRTARHLAEAQSLLDESAARDVQRLSDGTGLSVAGLRVLPAMRRSNALRYWLCAGGVTPPPTARLSEALRQAIEAQDDHQPLVVWGGHALRRYRDRLFVTPATAPRIGDRREWPVRPDGPFSLGDGLGTLRWTRQAGGLDAKRLPTAVEVRRRRGGESLKPHRLSKTRSVQHLCQSLGVLPWMRGALPLVFAGESLIAIGDLWLDARWCVAPDTEGLAVLWETAPLLV